MNHCSRGIFAVILLFVVCHPAFADIYGDAVDYPSLSFTSGGESAWFRDKQVSFDGIDSAASGSLGDGETSWMETTVAGPAELSFYYRTSTQHNSDYLSVTVDGSQVLAKSGETVWTSFTVPVGAGTHTVRWAYQKNGSASSGSDRVWVDQITLLRKINLSGNQAYTNSYYFGNEPQEAFDGITIGSDSDGGGNFWAGYGFGSYLSVPLETPAIVDQVRIAFEQGNFYSYRIAVDVSPFGQEQRRVLNPVDSSQATEGFQSFDVFDGGLARHLTVVGYGTFISSWNTYREVEAWGRIPQSIPLDEALDNPLMSFSNGAIPWGGTDVSSANREDYARSAVIGNNQSSIFTTILQGPGILSFDVCVSSEKNYDDFQLLIDGNPVVVLSGEFPWHRRTVAIPSGQHTVTWCYQKDYIDLAPVGDDAACVDNVTYLPGSISLPTALDNTGLSFSTNGWNGQSWVSNDGTDAAFAGAVQDGQSRDLSTTVTGPGILDFSWKVSSEPDYDFLQLYIGGALIQSISGEQDWSRVVESVPAGNQTVTWRYVKDGNVSLGADMGFVDQLNYRTVDTTPVLSVDDSGFAIITRALEAITTEFRISAGPSVGEVYLRDGSPVPVQSDGYFTVSTADAAAGLLLVQGDAPSAEFVIYAAENVAGSITYTAESVETPVYPNEFRSIDGSGNNIHFADFGKADVPLLRSAPAVYSDGVGAPSGVARPNPRAISNISCVAQGDATQPNSGRITDLFWQWGQFLDHDIDLTPEEEPHESFPISVPVGDPYFDPFNAGNITIPLSRSIFEIVDGVRQQTNAITAFVDGSNVYGSDQSTLDSLKAADFATTGKLAVSDGDLLPLGPSSRGGLEFKAGDVRVVEQIGLTSMHTLFVREHNWWAARIQAENPGLSGEGIFQRARAIVAGEMQRITYREFLPILLGPNALPTYQGYHQGTNPGIVNVFSTAAYRFGHTMLSPRLLRMQTDGHAIPAGHAALRDAFFQPPTVLQNNGGIEPIFFGLTSQVAQEIDNLLIDDVRNFLFGPPSPTAPPDQRGFDLAALNIQRGRDHGLPDLNTIRLAYGLPAFTDWGQITSDPERCVCLSNAYNGDINQVDPWVGILGEDHAPGARIGTTGQAVIADQFRRLRDGDRFWYQSYFSGSLLQEIEAATLTDIIVRNTALTRAEIQENGFIRPKTRFTSIRRNGNQFDLQFGTLPGAQYFIEASATMQPGSWATATASESGFGAELNQVVPIEPGSERVYFRIAESPLP